MAWAAIAGSIRAGCATEAGRYRPRRCDGPGVWAVVHTDRPTPTRAARGSVMAGSGAGGEHDDVGVDLGVPVGVEVGGLGVVDEVVAVDVGGDRDDVLQVAQPGIAGRGDEGGEVADR